MDQETAPRHPTNTTQSAKAVGVAAGTTLGFGCGVMLFVVGLLISLTGIGVIIGVPLMLAGILTPIFGLLMGLAKIKGPCPYCGTLVYASSSDPGVTCPGCKKRIVIRQKQFVQDISLYTFAEIDVRC